MLALSFLWSYTFGSNLLEKQLLLTTLVNTIVGAAKMEVKLFWCQPNSVTCANLSVIAQTVLLSPKGYCFESLAHQNMATFNFWTDSANWTISSEKDI